MQNAFDEYRINEQSINSMADLPFMVQENELEDQDPDDWHVILLEPDESYPVLHEYVWLEPYVVFPPELAALEMEGGLPQSTHTYYKYSVKM